MKGKRYFRKIRRIIRSRFDENEEQHFHEENIEVMHQHHGYSEFSKLLRSYIPKNALVLDLGCNKGFETAIIAQTNKVVGVELFKDFVNVAKKERKLDARQMDFHNLTFHNEFDCVYSNNTLEHSRYPDKVIKGVAYALKKNGLFIIGMPTDGNNPAISDPAHHFRATKEDVLRLLESDFIILESYEIDTKERWDWDNPPSKNKMLIVVSKIKNSE